jgi:acyl-CoA synthetase (AMP-forming)/AMP-acid ligase II/acyl carrier protein
MTEYQHPVEKNMSFSNLVDVTKHLAAKQGQKTAFTFLIDGDKQKLHLTYRELDVNAKAIAAFLQDAGLSGERALLLYPPGLDFICAFFGCLYSGIVAVPITPPIGQQMLSIVEPIVNDAGPRAILTTLDISSKLKKIKPIQSIGEKSFFKVIGKGIDKFFPLLKLLKNKDTRLIATDGIDADLGQMWQEPDISSDSLAFLQYTSGSTSQPKGVMVSHGNILHNQYLIQHYLKHPGGIVVVGWLPQYHDMGLIGNILQPFYLGGQSILFSPFDFLKKPLNWLTTISKYRAHTSGGPNFAYELCTRKVSAEDKKILDLSSWRVAYNGAEPIRSSTLENFSNYFAECGFQKSAFFPCYGLAEGTLMVTGGKQKELPVYLTCDKEKLKENRIHTVEPASPVSTILVGSGTAFYQQKISVVEPEECIQLGDNEIGEIWVSGPSVARGYWNNPEGTRDTFQSRIQNSDEGPFLRTGDLGFLRDGDLFITGRLKDLIIIRGQNFFPSDIEHTVEKSHSNLRKGCSAAFSVEQDVEEKLVVICEIRKKVKKTEFKNIVAGIHRDISENHGINASQIVLIKAKTIPKTTSGKIRRKICKLSFLNNKLNTIYQFRDKKRKEVLGEPGLPQKKDIVETKKTERRSKEEVYGWLLEKINKISADAITKSNLKEKTLSDTDLDSAGLIELISDFEVKFDCHIALEEILETTSLSEICEYLYNAACTTSS